MTKRVSLDVLTTSNNRGGATLANLLPIEGGDGLPANDAVDDAKDPQDDGGEQTKQVAETHHREAPRDVDQALHEAVVEESELGHHQGEVELTKDHDNTECNTDGREDKDGEAVVLVAQNSVGAEKAASVHVDPALIGGAALAVVAIIVTDAEVVSIDGQVLNSDDFVAIGGLLCLEASLQRLVFGIALLDKLGVLSGPLEADAVEGASPDIVGAQTLVLSESDSGLISDEPLNQLATEEAASVTRNADDAENSQHGTSDDARDHNNLS